MASSFRIGQCIEGKISTYALSKQLHKDIWTATTSELGKVIIKKAPKYRLETERDILRHFHARPGIRQLLDEVQNPPSLVLKHLDESLLTVSNTKRLEKREIKFVAKKILEALQAFHEDGYVHTDVKPDNILINYSSGPHRFRDVELGDCGDVCLVNPKDHLKLGESGHIIGAHMFRSPEAMLSLRWGTATDIWSFGTTLISLIWGLGWHIFKPNPKDAEPDDELYPNHVLAKQIAFFGPIPLSYFAFLPEDDERWEFIGDATQYIIDHKKWKPFAQAEDKELAEEDRTFIYEQRVSCEWVFTVVYQVSVACTFIYTFKEMNKRRTWSGLGSFYIHSPKPQHTGTEERDEKDNQEEVGEKAIKLWPMVDKVALTSAEKQRVNKIAPQILHA
ncbi:related to serine/threonine protein kinase [Rhynchosporium secalis]|uniref:Related to serine/threonine protein kinase n=1 Tax=Rhynchosporium secalis TaxID=38038 RepID=A0A1E1LVH7_RHYSE|nr:related to serine/threonine protein kinase [Rhynchosporium secalis]